MMNITFDIVVLITAFAAFVRVSSLIVLLPIFGETNVPIRVKILLSVALTALVFPNLKNIAPAGVSVTEPVFLTIVVVKEIVIGLTIALIAKILFDCVVQAASLLGYQMGFGTANLMAPGSDEQMNAFTSLHRILVIIIFLSLDLHHIFITGLVTSFELIPLGQVVLNEQLGSMLVGLTASIFSVSLKLAAPVLIALMFTMAALGLIAKTVPQMNVFTMSFPISFFVGLLIYVATTPYFSGWFLDHFQKGSEKIFLAINGLAG